MRNVVLIVDDMKFNRQILKDILEDEYQIAEAENGKVALDVIEAKHEEIAAVLLDIVMPEMDGVHTLKQIRAIPEMKDMKIIFYTSEPKEDIENALKKVYPDELGQLHYLIKPSSPETISIAIQSVL